MPRRECVANCLLATTVDATRDDVAIRHAQASGVAVPQQVCEAPAFHVWEMIAGECEVQ